MGADGIPWVWTGRWIGADGIPWVWIGAACLLLCTSCHPLLDVICAGTVDPTR